MPINRLNHAVLYVRDVAVSWLLPADLITEEVRAQGLQTLPLDLDAEIARYGAQTRGGVGVSIPVL